MKIMLLAGLYLFFVRVLWAVYTELRDPRTRVARRSEALLSSAPPDGAVVAPQTARSSRRGGAGSGGAGATAVIVGQLIVIEPPPMAGVTYALASEITIGRAPTCGIHVDDGYVSQVHARVFATNGTFFVEDLGSSNGSTLNGRAITTTTPLAPGDLLQIGATLMEFS